MSIGNLEIPKQPNSEHFLSFAESYRQAALDFCHRMEKHDSQVTWPNSCVVLFLTAHSVELFLKGAILIKNPAAKFGPKHCLVKLHEKYRITFPEPELEFDRFFRTENFGVSESEWKEFLTNDKPESIRYRYPVDLKGKPWPDEYAFQPGEMLEALISLGEDYSRIRALLMARAQEN